ncbi:hypothetical protein CR513_46157, partial [Mucuna pruriens]
MADTRKSKVNTSLFDNSSSDEHESMFDEEEISYDTLLLHSYKISIEYNEKGKIVGIGKVGKHSLPTIENVLYVDGLKYNLLGISQFCNNGYVISFNKDICILVHINLKHISKLYEKHLVKGLLEISWESHLLCDTCKKGKQIKNMFGPTKTLILGGKKYYHYR